MPRLRATDGNRKGRARLAFAISLGLVPLSAAWVAAPLAWPLDLLGNLSAHVLPVVVLTAAWWTFRRYRRAALTGWLSAALLAWPLAAGRAPAAPAGAPTVRVLVYNALTGRRPAHDEIELVLGSGADLVALFEPPDRMIAATERGGLLRRAYPHSVLRTWNSATATSYQVVLSRWPLTRPDGRPADESFGDVIEAVAHPPGGPVGLVLVHPRSPRTPARWRLGLAEVERAAAAARRRSAEGMPVIVLGDMNSTPAGLTSRRLASRAGLRRCKPWLNPGGTFPAYRPWPLRIAIDDALVSRGVTVAAWRTLPPAGSDHRPVLIELVLPPRR